MCCLSYIQAIIRHDITMTMQQCARFCNIPNKEHEEAVKHITRYLLKTKDQGFNFRPDLSKSLEFHVDTDWTGFWKHRSSHGPLSTHTRTCFIITYVGFPLV